MKRYFGRCFMQSIVTAIVLIVKSTNLLAASGDIGADAYERGDYAAAARELLAADITNNPDAQVLLGYLYDQGLGVKRDQTEAAKWYLAAAENGNPIAQLNIGIMYGDGDGVSRDLVQAFRWFDRASTTFPAGDDRNDAISKRELARKLMTPDQRQQVEAGHALY